MTRYLAIDTETHRFGVGCMAPPVVCLSWACDDSRGLATNNGGSVVGEEKLYLPEMTPDYVLERAISEGVHLVGHNMAYDMTCMVATYPHILDPVLDAYQNRQVHCTWIREKLRAIYLDLLKYDPDIGRPPTFSLEELVRKRFGRELPKKDTYRLRYEELDGVPLQDWPEEAINYSMNDSIETWNVYASQESEGIVYPDETSQARADFAFYLQKCWGQEYRQSKVIALESFLRERLYSPVEQEEHIEFLEKLGLPADLEAEVKASSIEATLQRHNVIRANGTHNTAETKARVWSHFTGVQWDRADAIQLVEKKAKDEDGAPVYPEPSKKYPWTHTVETLERARVITRDMVPQTDGGGVATNKDTLYQTDDGVLHLLERRNNILKGLGTFLPKLLPLTHPSVNVLVSTGRTSMSNHNAQQTPRIGNYRGCLVSRPGWVVIWSDYSAIELCTLSESCFDEFGFSKLGELLQQGIDPHLWFGLKILEVSQGGRSIPYEDAVRIIEEGTDKETCKLLANMRQMAKAANFGFPGGLGYNAFVVYARESWSVNITVAAAKALKELWLATFTEMDMLFQCVKALGEPHTYTLPKSGRVRGGLKFTSGCNTRFQGPAADLNKDAVWEVCRAQRKPPTWEPEVYRTPLVIPGWSNLLSGTKQINFVHDEQVLEAPGSWDLMGVPRELQPKDVSAPEAIKHVLEQTMVKVGQRWLKHVPVKVKGTIAPCWGK